MFSQNGLGLDDVLLVPSASDVLPNEIDISTQVAENMTLSIPVVGATRFATVANAIDFAKEGTLAILPVQLSTPENVTKIKQLDNQYLVGVSVEAADNVDELVQAGADVVQVLPTYNQNFLVKNISEIKSSFNALPVWFGPVDDLEIAKQSLLAGADTIIIGTTAGQPL